MTTPDNLAKEAWLYILRLKIKLAPPPAPQQHPNCKCFIPESKNSH